jgi:hypothetical protein
MMSATSSLRRSLLMAALLVALPSGGSEKDFEEALQLVDRTIAAGKAKKAKELLVTTIEESKDQPWALYHLTEIMDDLRRATFWSSNEKPEPKTLVSGELMSWSPSSGQIKLRYRVDPDAEKPSGKTKGSSGARKGGGRILADFTEHGSLLFHPLAFEGPFTIEIQGDSYPALSEPAHPPAIVVCADWSQSTIVSFGLPPQKQGTQIRYVPARIVHVENGEATTEAEAQCTAMPGTEYDLKVVVSSSSITAFSSDQKLLTAKKPESVYGQFGVQNCPRVTEILVTGKIQPSWLQGVVDAALQEKWTTFEKSYKPIADLPVWLREKAWASAFGAPVSDEAVPGKEDPGDKERMRAFLTLAREKGPQAAFDYARGLPAEGTKEELRSWLAAIALWELGCEKEALEACAKVCALDQQFFPARRMRVRLVAAVSTYREAIEDCKSLVADFPRESAAYLGLTELELLDGHPEDARAAVRAAIDAGVPAGILEDAEHLVARALKGPLWSRSYEYKSEHYVISSDISQPLCFQAANLLEKFYAKFNIHLRRVAGQEKRTFRVYLFSGRAGYDAYTKDLLGKEKKNTAGLYSPLVKQLLIWNLPDAESMMRTIRHEGFHQYLDRLVGWSPVWLNEGLAEYFEGSRLVNAAWSDGEMQPGHVRLLQKSAMTPLKDFVRIHPGAFYEPKSVDLNYAEAWAFVHFLLNSGAKNKQRFERLLDALIGGAKPRAAIAEVFDEASLSKLEPEFADYVRGLK